MASRSQDICGIEIGKEAITIVQYAPADNTVAGVAIKPIEETGNSWWENVQNEVKTLAARMKLNGHDIICSVPAENAVIKRLMLDSNEQEVDEWLQWEVGQQIVGSVDDYVLDYQKIEAGNPGSVEKYLVVAYPNDAINRVTALLRSCRTNPLIVDLDIFALVNIFEQNYRDIITLPAVLVLGGEEYTKVALTCNGDFIDYEFFKNDSDSLEPQAYCALVNKCLEKLAVINAGLMGAGTPAVYVAGALFSHDDFTAQCVSLLHNAEPIFPFKTIPCRALSDNDLQRYSPQLSVAIGLALRGIPELMP